MDKKMWYIHSVEYYSEIKKEWDVKMHKNVDES